MQRKHYMLYVKVLNIFCYFYFLTNENDKIYPISSKTVQIYPKINVDLPKKLLLAED